MLTGAQRLCRKWGFTVQRKSLGNLTSNYLQQSETPTSVSTLLCSIYLIMAAGGGGQHWHWKKLAKIKISA